MLLAINKENLHLPLKSQMAKSGLREVQPGARSYKAQRGFCRRGATVLSASFSVCNAALVGLWSLGMQGEKLLLKAPLKPCFCEWISLD